MKLHLNLNDYCTPDVYDNGEQILKNNQIRNEDVCTLDDGSFKLRGKAVDSFHFVDNPHVTISKGGDSILSFGCNCPQYRSTREFCPHCAGLVLKFISRTAVTGSTADSGHIPAQAAANTDITNFSYAFANSGRDLYPGIYRPQIPLKRFIQVFGDNIRARTLYKEYQPWGGSCFGMTISSTMFFIPHSGIDLADFDENARYPSQLKLSQRSDRLDMTLHEFIEAGLILQSSDALMSARFAQMHSGDCLDALCDAVEQFQQTGENPVCIAVWDAGYQGGHSVLPYRLERIAGSEDILHIYDPNCPMQVRYAYLGKDNQGHHIDWRFPMYNDYPYSNKTGGYITFDRYEHYKKAWDRRGSPDVHILLTAEPGTCLLDSDGNSLAAITGSGVVSNAADIFPHLPTGIGKKTSQTLCAPVAAYILRNDDASKQELNLQVTHTQQMVSVQTNGREVEILVDDNVQTQYVAICQPDTPYSITLSSSIEDSWAEVKLEGITGPEGICLAQHNGILYCTPLSEALPVSVTVNGNPESTDIFRTNLDEIFRKEPELLTNTAETNPDQTHP